MICDYNFVNNVIIYFKILHHATRKHYDLNLWSAKLDEVFGNFRDLKGVTETNSYVM